MKVETITANDPRKFDADIEAFYAKHENHGHVMTDEFFTHTAVPMMERPTVLEGVGQANGKLNIVMIYSVTIFYLTDKKEIEEFEAELAKS